MSLLSASPGSGRERLYTIHNTHKSGGPGPLPSAPERHREKENGNTTPFTAGNQTDEHLRNKNCHTPEHYTREREVGSGRGRLARARDTGWGHGSPEPGGDPLDKCGNTSLRALHSTENKTKPSGSDTRGALAELSPGLALAELVQHRQLQ